MSVVVDASVAFKWFVPDEQLAREAGAVLTSDPVLLAPDFLVAEVCNIAWRSVRLGRIPPRQADSIAAVVAGFFSSLTATSLLAPRAIAIARELDHPVYDCLYLALAEAHQTTLVTADTRFLAKLSGSGWKASAVALASYGA